jgi:hypothetical protein
MERTQRFRYVRATEGLTGLVPVARTFRRGPGHNSTSWPRAESNRASSSENRSSPPSDGANVSLQIAILIALLDPGVAEIAEFEAFVSGSGRSYTDAPCSSLGEQPLAATS